MSVLELLAPRVYDWQTDRIIRRRQELVDREIRNNIRQAWRELAERPALGLSHAITTPIGMLPGRFPLLDPDSIDIGDESLGTLTSFTVELRPGQVLADVEDVAGEIAETFDAHKARLIEVGHGRIVIELVRHDPHAAVVTSVELEPGMITLGPDEYGDPVRFEPGRLPHIAIQGTTGGGKTTGTYHLLRQLVTTPGVKLAGVDPSGILWRPLPPDRWRVSGLADPRRCVDALAELVDEMDRRIARIPEDDDRLPCGPGEADPWLFILLEELPGLLIALEAADRKYATAARASISRLSAEGRKAGIRLVMIAQRFDATSTAGATVRNNCGLRISFAVENRSAVEFLHENATPDVVAEHITAEPGVSLVSAPGAKLRRVRWPVVSYREWAQTARHGVSRAA